MENSPELRMGSIGKSPRPKRSRLHNKPFLQKRSYVRFRRS